MSTAPMTSNSSPATTTSPEVTNDTIVTQTQQSVTDARATRSSRAVNAYGVTIMRGGNVLGTGFYDSIINAYTNVVYQPVGLPLMVLSLLVLSSLYTNNKESDPFYIGARRLLRLRVELSSTSNTVQNNILSLLAAILGLFTKYRYFIGSVMAYSFPYFCKPSKRNALFSGGLTAVSLALQYSVVSVIVLSNAFFLFTQLRSPPHKFIVCLFAVICVMLNSQQVASLTNVAGLTEEYGLASVTTPTVNSNGQGAPTTLVEENGYDGSNGARLRRSASFHPQGSGDLKDSTAHDQQLKLQPSKPTDIGANSETAPPKLVIPQSPSSRLTSSKPQSKS